MPTPRSSVTLQVNGAEEVLALEPRRTLLDALRSDLQLTGTKKVCDMGDCGACTVLVDGRAVYACLLLAVDCEGREITTVERRCAWTSSKTLRTLWSGPWPSWSHDR